MERDTLDGVAHFLDYEIASASHLGSRGKFLEEISAGVHRGNPQVRTAKINSNREWGHGLDNDHRKLIFYDRHSFALAASSRQPGRSHRTGAFSISLRKAFKKIWFCSGVPTVTRIAVGAPQGPSGRMITPSSCSRLATDAASSPSSQ